MPCSSLLAVPRGGCAVVQCIDPRCRIGARLLELGLTPGAGVRRLFAAPAGEPSVYLVHGTMIALRNEDAACVRVCSVPGGMRTWC